MQELHFYKLDPADRKFVHLVADRVGKEELDHTSEGAENNRYVCLKRKTPSEVLHYMYFP